MLVLYLLQRHLKRKDDASFILFWEHKFLHRLRYYLFGAFLYYVFVVGILVELLLWGNQSFLFGILVFAFVALFYGSMLLRFIIQFFSTHNQRYILLRSGFQTETFDKSNVIN